MRAGVFGALGVLAMMASFGLAAPLEDKTADTSTIMTKSFGKGGYKMSVAAAAKAGEWDAAQKLAKEWTTLSADLGANKPPKGDIKSWETQCKKFVESTKAVYEGTEKKDPKAVTKAIGSINCGNCHKAHKGS
jgi:hypothetical protein